MRQYYVRIADGVVTDRIVFEGSMPHEWADPADTWIKHDTAQVGWEVVDGEPVEPVVAPYVPTADDVRAECQRRVMVLTGTEDIIKCLIKQHNAQMRATELVLKKVTVGTWTTAEAAEAAALQGMADAIKALRAKSNVLEAAPPTDYTDDKYWV